MSEPAQAIYWSQNTGYICVSESAIASAEMQNFYRENPNYRVAYEQLKYAQRMPFAPALIRIQREVIQPNLEAPVVGMSTVEQTMAAAEKQANDILAGKETPTLKEEKIGVRRRRRTPPPPCRTPYHTAAIPSCDGMGPRHVERGIAGVHLFSARCTTPEGGHDWPGRPDPGLRPDA